MSREKVWVDLSKKKKTILLVYDWMFREEVDLSKNERYKNGGWKNRHHEDSTIASSSSTQRGN